MKIEICQATKVVLFTAIIAISIVSIIGLVCFCILQDTVVKVKAGLVQKQEPSMNTTVWTK